MAIAIIIWDNAPQNVATYHIGANYYVIQRIQRLWKNSTGKDF
jgi:hypothetical protein